MLLKFFLDFPSENLEKLSKAFSKKSSKGSQQVSVSDNKNLVENQFGQAKFRPLRNKIPLVLLR
jgi:hypothetical protein